MRYMRAALLSSVVVVVWLALAAPAFAGTIRYTIPPGSEYTVQDNGNGIVKIFYNRCVVAGERVTFQFDLVANANQGGNATFSVLREEGTDPSTEFDVNNDGQFDRPPTITLQQGQDTTARITIQFSFPLPNNGVNQFRIKLDPENGEGLGQGAGIMVRIPCVLAAPPEGEEAPPPAAPAAGFIPPPTAPQAEERAPCVALARRVRARAGERVTLRVRVNANETNIQRALVRVIAPGVRIERRTNSEGIATFVFRPRRAGTIVIQSDVCFGADRVRVLGAQRALVRRQPRFTG